MNSLLSPAKPDYFSAAFSNIEQMLQQSSFSSTERSIADFLDDDGQEEANTLYSPWGEWLYWWDAISSMEDRLESKDIVSRAFMVEDILYYSHYIPYRGHNDELFNAAEMHVSYEDYEADPIYFGPAEAEESVGYALSSASYFPTPPDRGMEEKEDVVEDTDAANEALTLADEIHGPDKEKIEAQIEAQDIISQAIRLLFAPKQNKKISLPQKLKLFDKAMGNAFVSDND